MVGGGTHPSDEVARLSAKNPNALMRGENGVRNSTQAQELGELGKRKIVRVRVAEAPFSRRRIEEGVEQSRKGVESKNLINLLKKKRERASGSKPEKRGIMCTGCINLNLKFLQGIFSVKKVEATP